jgi:hypothetical protein
MGLKKRHGRMLRRGGKLKKCDCCNGSAPCGPAECGCNAVPGCAATQVWAMLRHGTHEGPPVTDYDHPVLCCCHTTDQIYKVEWDSLVHEQWSSCYRRAEWHASGEGPHPNVPVHYEYDYVSTCPGEPSNSYDGWLYGRRMGAGGGQPPPPCGEPRLGYFDDPGHSIPSYFPPQIPGLFQEFSFREQQDCNTVAWEYTHRYSFYPQHLVTVVERYRVTKVADPNGICIPPTCGACCCGGNCYQVPHSKCSEMRGTWHGAGSKCADVECVPVGGCCIGYECFDTTEALCAAAQGLWLAGASCAAQPDPGCPGPTGACCNGEGECTDDVTEKDCQGKGMTWFEGQSCVEVTCPILGACCSADGIGCSENLTYEQCSAPGFQWHPNQACEDIECINQFGPCCRPDGTCSVMIFEECAALGGNWWPPAYTCNDTNCDRGACCVAGTCTEVTEAECQQQGGTFFGTQTFCGSVSCPQCCACCLPDFTCVTVATEAECAAQQGTYVPGFTCSQVACSIGEGVGSGDYL